MEYIPFEKPIAELEIQINELRRMSLTLAVDLSSEISELEDRASSLKKQMFSNLSPYETTQISRHPLRPNSFELINTICTSFTELHGDRNYFDDSAIVCGVGKINNHSVVIMGHQKGRGTKDNIRRNFGMAKPEGYRKALRLMSFAERFSLPIISLIDTPGAYPGIGAEERGQSEAIGKNIMVMSKLKVPIISIVIGEGGSGGALALGVGNRVHMLQYATYSVISPEGCASILMKSAAQASSAANALKLTAASAQSLGVIDEIIPEPEGGAHRDLCDIAKKIKDRICQDLEDLSKLSGDELRTQRQEKFMSMGHFTE